MTSLLAQVYASAPEGEAIIPTLEIALAGKSTIRLVRAYTGGLMLLEDLSPVAHEASSFEYALPARNDTGQQMLNVAFADIDSRIREYLRYAIEQGESIILTLREYILDGTSSLPSGVPATAPLLMTVQAAEFKEGLVQVQCSYFDLLNSAWPRRRYTTDFAPGLRFLS